MGKIVSKLKQPMMLLLAVILVFGSAPVESILAALETDDLIEETEDSDADMTEEIESILASLAEEDADLLNDNEEGIEDVSAVVEEDAAADISADEVDEEQDTTVDEDEIDEEQDTSEDEEGVDEADIEAMSTAIVPMPMAAGSSLVFGPSIPPFDRYILTPGVDKEWIVPVCNNALRPMMDIVFVIDATGTMTAHFEAFQNALPQFAEDLRAAGATSIHFGVVYYGDYNFDRPGCLGHRYCPTPAPPYWFGMPLALGDHSVEQVRNAVNSIPELFGGDPAEDHVWAYMRAIYENDGRWREGAERIVVLITD